MLLTKSPLFIVTLLLAACAAPQTRTPNINNETTNAEAKKQQELVVEDYMSNYKKLQNVSSRIITNGSDLCGDKTAGYYGFNYWNQDGFKPAWKEVTKSKFNLDERFKILHVVEKSPAEKAALKEGDILVSINHWLVPIGKEADKQLAQKLAEQAKSLSPVEMSVLRDGKEHKVSITPVKSCDFQVHLAPDDTKNAYADGKNIVVYKGLMDFFKTDEEMALVVSHELAHNAMHHIDAKKKNATAGGIFGLLLDIAAATAGVNTNGDFSRLGAGIAGNAYSVEFEQEADYVGLYVMQKAGFNIDNAAGFWRRMAINNSQAITTKSSHPTTPERFVAIEETVKEIKGKLEKGAPLNPELKK
ncbi:M48 family metallopeptidase [Methylotenera mobilis]|uniref:M48 family metallopeptidase n=1 Tax=Methylotenera mobilis TaxID=359408 RepID=UPI00035FF464|nr:M48 family metallopeptidase [Methylotenera mobilis]PPC96423.1 MAG: peptidase M48 Ste24p [Methylotenera sp.]